MAEMSASVTRNRYGDNQRLSHNATGWLLVGQSPYSSCNHAARQGQPAIFDLPALLALGLFCLVNFAAASSGAVFKPGTWYESLARPPWTPPNWAFPLVWSVLFLLNAISGWLVWQAAGAAAALPLSVYAVSLAINAAWSALFFGLKRMDWGLADVVALWLSIVAVMVLFAPVSPLATLLQVPYLVWVTIAAALNLRMLQLNPAQATPGE